MRKIGLLGVFFLIIIGFLWKTPACAMDFNPPEAPEEVREFVKYEPESFAQGLWNLVREGIEAVAPELRQAGKLCLSLAALMMLLGVLKSFQPEGGAVSQWVAAVAVGGLLLSDAHDLIQMGAETISEMSEYGKLLIPVMTGALAAQGGLTSSAALCAGTVAFDAVLSAAVSGLLIPVLYLFLALSVAAAATGEKTLEKIRDFLKWAVSWGLKTTLYLFTGYMGITGAVSGAADATAVKATKLTISGMVPVVGGILSDASEAVVVGAGVMKNAAGVYGLLVILALWITPFLRLGIQYLMLKATAILCESFDVPKASGLIGDFSGAMGLLLAMTGTVCLILLISIVCFMKGMG